MIKSLSGVALAYGCSLAALLAVAGAAVAEPATPAHSGRIQIAQAQTPDPKDPKAANRRGRPQGQRPAGRQGAQPPPGGRPGTPPAGRAGPRPGAGAGTRVGRPPAAVARPPRVINSAPARTVAPPPARAATPTPTPPAVRSATPAPNQPGAGGRVQRRPFGIRPRPGAAPSQPNTAQPGTTTQPPGGRGRFVPGSRPGFQPRPPVVGQPRPPVPGTGQGRGFVPGSPPGGFIRPPATARPGGVVPPGGGRPGFRPGTRPPVIGQPARPPRDNRWRNRAIGGAVIGGAAVLLGAAALAQARRDAEERRRRRDGFDDRDDARLGSFDDLRRNRREIEDRDGHRVIVESDRRRIIRGERGSVIRYDESEWLRRVARDRSRVERRRDGTIVTTIGRPGGVEIVSITDEDGRLLRRLRRFPDGREVILIDTGRRYWPGARRARYAYVDIAPPEVRIPRSSYIVEYRDASASDIYAALAAAPIDDLRDGYSLEQVRDTFALREYMRRVDLDGITFGTGEFRIERSQYSRMENIALAILQILKESPDEVFLIEGHTDAMGGSDDNLSLSDRRAQSVASVLVEEFGVPAENLVTQGYGEQFLKVRTREAERANRRVAVRRITPLLARGPDVSDDDREPDARDERDDERREAPSDREEPDPGRRR